MVTEARIRANEKYNAKAYDRVYVRVKKGDKEKIEAAAEAAGKSLNAFIVDAVMDKVECPK